MIARQGHGFVSGVIGCGIAAVATLVGGGLCCLKAPVPPQWDTALVLPLYQGQFRLLDLIDPGYFNIADDSSLRFASTRLLDTMRPAGAVEFLTIDEPSDIKVCDFLFPSLGCAPSGLSMEELLGVSIPDSGIKSRVEPFVVSGNRACAIEDVERVDLVDGMLGLEIANLTSLEFDSVLVTTPVGAVRVDRVAAHEIRREHLAVAGNVLSSPLEFGFTAGSSGSKSDTVHLRKADSLVFRFVLDSVRIARGRLKIPSVEVTRRCVVRMECVHPMRIDSLVLSRGECLFSLNNRFGFPIRLRLDAPKLSKSEESCVDGNSGASYCADLRGLRLDTRARTNSLFEFRVTATVERSTEYVDIGKDDGVLISYKTSGLVPEIVVGQFLEPVYVAAMLDTILDLRSLDIHGVRLADAELVIDLESDVGFRTETELKLTSIRDGRSVLGVAYTLVLPPAEAGRPARSSWTIPLAALINCGPDLIIAEHVTRVLGSGWYEANSAVSGSAIASGPLRMALVRDTVDIAPRRAMVTPAQRAAITDHLISGEVSLTAANKFPFAGGGRFILTPAAGERNPETIVDSLVFEFAIPAGRVDRMGRCVAPRETTLCLELDSTQTTLFRSWPIDARLQVILPQTDTVVVRASDYLGIDGLLSLRLRVKERP
ncbi:MAG: hypothetical protein ABIK86_01455 [candidate division WOR-3 bacterium]